MQSDSTLGELMQAHIMLSVIASQRVFRTSADIATLFPVTAWQQYGAQLEGITNDVRDAMVQVYSELLTMRGSYVWAIVEQSGGTLTPEMADQIRRTDADVLMLRTMLSVGPHPHRVDTRPDATQPPLTEGASMGDSCRAFAFG